MHRIDRVRASLAIALVAALLVATGLATSAGASSNTFTVAPWGSDTEPGTAEAPFRTLAHGMRTLEAGDTLIVRGGTYDERVLLSSSAVAKGRADAPIVVRAAEGEQPVLRGRLKLSHADHWTIQGIDVTWSSANAGHEHMVQFWGGAHWRFTDAEVWGARSYSAINVDNGATDFRLDHLYVHDTHPTNGLNQDHLIYIARSNRRGVIERNVLARSPNGRGIKVGPGSPDDPSSHDLVIRYNTFVDNAGPSNVRFTGDSSGNEVYRNIFVRSGSGFAAVTGHELRGTGNVIRDNIAWATDGVVEPIAGLVDGGNNAVVDPRFADPAAGDFRPSTAAATDYGAHAPGDIERTMNAPGGAAYDIINAWGSWELRRYADDGSLRLYDDGVANGQLSADTVER